MTETNIEKRIHDAVSDCLTGLDHLPSQENEIIQRVREKKAMEISYPKYGSRSAIQNQQAASNPGKQISFRVVLAAVSVLVLLVGVLAMNNPSFLSDLFQPMDTVSTQPSESLASPEESPDSAFAGIVDQKAGDADYPLDRIDLEIDPDLLWNEETGILTEGDQVEKTPGILPFKNTVYRQSFENGISAEGELVYQSDQGAVLFRDKISLRLGGDSYSLDMPQKSFQIEALDGAFEFRIFDDRSAESYPSLLLRNSGNDCLFTRVADGVQHRLIEKYTDMHLLTLAWRPVQVYLNGKYWGIYNIRESMDAHTICRYEQIPDDTADSITILQIGGSAIQGSPSEYKTLLMKIKNSNPAENPEDLEYLEQEIDIDSFLDWLAVEMFFGNSDIGTGRIYKVPGGKWKCLVQDLDYGLYQSDFNSVQSYLKPEGMGQKKIDNTIFRKILEVDKYRDLFLTKLGKLYQALTTEVMQQELDFCAAWIEPGMKAHLERWAPYNDGTIIMDAPSDPAEAWDYWKQRIDRMRNGTMVKRPWYVYLYTQEFFGLSNQEMVQYFGPEQSEGE